MEYFIDTETLEFLWAALTEKRGQRQSMRARYYFEKFLKTGWAFRADLEDVLDYSDPRLNPNRLNLIEFVKAVGINWELVCFHPKAKSIFVSEFDAIRVEDATFLLIMLERIGFQVDPSFLVDKLLPEIKSRKKKIFSSSELEIFWFNRCRHRNAPISLMLQKGVWGDTKETLKTDAGYQIDLKADDEGKPVRLKITAPRFRKVEDPVRTTCVGCGMDWYKGDPDSSANHRKEHKRRMAYLEPKPCMELIAERMSNENADLVTSNSPVWKHHEMYSRALAFKREFRYDFVQWQSPTGDNDPNAHGILFTNEQGAIVGACSFRDRTGDDKIKLWGLDWVWFCPKERRNGHLSQKWKELRAHFGDFVVESPVSDEMMAFLKKNNDSILVHHPKDRSKK